MKISAAIILFFGLIIPAAYPEAASIRENLKSEDPEVRSEACLELIGEGEGAAGLLVPLLGDRSFLVRHSAAYALARIGGAEAEAAFRQGLSAPSPDRRRISVLGLGMLGRAGRETVSPLLGDPDWEVRWSAAYVLGRAGEREDLARLGELARNDPYRDPATGDYPVREAAEKSIRRLNSIVGWRTDHEEARTRAVRTGRPLFLYFRSGGSEVCRNFERQVLTEEKIIDAAQRMVPVWLDHPAAAGTFSQYRVTRVPAIVISSPDGARRERIEGTVSPEDLLDRMLAVLEPEKSAPRLRSRLNSNPRDLEAAWQLSAIYLERGMWDGAEQMLNRIVSSDPDNLSSLLDNALFARAYLAGRRGDFAGSARQVEALLERFSLFGDRAEALYCGGLAHLRSGNPDRGRELLRRLVEDYPGGELARTASGILDGSDRP